MEYSLAGLFVGFAVGATGVGGGALMTPILIIGFGVPASIAVGTDLLFASVTKAFGVGFHRNHGTVDWDIVKRMAAGSIPAALATILLLQTIGLGPRGEVIIQWVLAIAIISTAILSLGKGLLQRKAQQRSGTPKQLSPARRTVLTIVAGAVIGVLVTLSSVGAGVIGAVTLLMLYPRMPAIRVVGTDLAHAVLLTTVAGIGHWGLGTVDLKMLGLLLIGSLPGIWLGTKVGFRLPDHFLRPIISGILIVIGISLLFTSTH